MQTKRNRTTPSRRRVAQAFRRMARAADLKSAYARTVRFYRSGGQAWTRALA